MEGQVSRRAFLKASAGSMAAAAMLAAGAREALAQGVNGVSPALRKFITPLRGLGPTGIPVASANTTLYPGVDYYQIAMGQFTDLLHPDLPNPTTLYGYWDATSPVKRHLGGLIVAQNGRPARVKFTHAAGADQLPASHILPVDVSIPGAELAQNRTAVHLHGGFVPWVTDGGPFHWTAPDGSVGESLVGTAWLPDASGALTNDYWFPNLESARLMWYHDHAIGITRLNAYAGLATGYVVRDGFEQALVATGAIPGLVPGTEIPLVFQDKVFKQFADAWGGPGDLWYPSVYGKTKPGFLPVPFPSAVPESFGDTILTNGAAYPFINVEPRRYRFRILNAQQSGFLNLQLYFAKKNAPKEASTANPGPPFVQIGTEGGFLPAPVVLNQQKIAFNLQTGLPSKYTLLLGPAERADIVVDFTNVPVGSKLIFYTDAPGPFPMGLPPIAPLVPGMSPDTMNLVQLNVVPRGSVTGSMLDPGYGTPIVLPAIPPLNTAGIAPLGKTLNEGFDPYGRLIQNVGTTTPVAPGVYARPYEAPATEVAAPGEVQVWDIYNLTADTHPMHFHLVNVQIIGRAPFNVKGPVFAPIGAFIPSDPNEMGWKETVRMNPGQVTRVAMKFDLPPVPSNVVANTPLGQVSYPVSLPTSPRTGGHEYVWHCHILEHEEHDMMRPLIVS